MKRRHIVQFVFVTALLSLFVLLQSCKKKESQEEPLYLTADIAGSVIQNGLYYPLSYQERSVEIDFSAPLDSSSIQGNISFSDKNGALDSVYKLTSSGRKIIMAFKAGFRLNDGWRYLVTMNTALKSTSGLTFPSNTVIEIRTSAKHLLIDNDTVKRNSIICISDIHMGDSRSAASGYCWFSKNAAALESLLNVVLTSEQVRQLVILGDLFDEWVVPYRVPPFDPASGIYNSRDYFVAIANSAVNINVFNKLKAIASGGVVQLIYVPGNHDMLLTKEILQEIIPGVIWKGDSTGLGHYSPLNEIIMEHGHRFDFFNCPQPLSNPGHILPPGYFISRLDAEGLMEHHSTKQQELKSATGQVEFLAAWTAAYEYLKIHYSLTVAADSSNILMRGIDNYQGPLSFNGTRDMYAGNIEDSWPATQIRNAVPLAMPVLMAILDGSSDLSLAASYEYMISQAPTLYKIVAFGHTHNPMIKVYPPGKQYTGIYANTGSWVNAELSSKQVRTFLVIKPGEWTGSDLDLVSLFQYNLDSGSGNPAPEFLPVLISEESIERGN